MDSQIFSSSDLAVTPEDMKRIMRPIMQRAGIALSNAISGDKCPRCSGLGYIPPADFRTDCPVCLGSGAIHDAVERHKRLLALLRYFSRPGMV